MHSWLPLDPPNLKALLTRLALLSAASIPVAGCHTEDPTSEAAVIVGYLDARDWKSLSEHVHPVSGVLLSPYGYVDSSEAVVLSREEVRHLDTDSTTRIWGSFDGTGEPIRMTFSEYYERFIYDADYATLDCGAPDERIGTGNTLNNIDAVFSGQAVFIECHYPGSDQYGGMDWRSLRIVLEPAGKRWLLVGLVHDEWTI